MNNEAAERLLYDLRFAAPELHLEVIRRHLERSAGAAPLDVEALAGVATPEYAKGFRDGWSALSARLAVQLFADPEFIAELDQAEADLTAGLGTPFRDLRRSGADDPA